MFTTDIRPLQFQMKKKLYISGNNLLLKSWKESSSHIFFILTTFCQKKFHVGIFECFMAITTTQYIQLGRYTMAFLHNFKANVGLSQMLNNDIIKEVKTERCHDFFFDMLNETAEDFITDDKKILTSVSKVFFHLQL